MCLYHKINSQLIIRNNTTCPLFAIAKNFSLGSTTSLLLILYLLHYVLETLSQTAVKENDYNWLQYIQM